MRGATRFYAVLLIIVCAGFGFGLFRLFVLRFEAGDIYPPYSSLRSDPLGSKALYRSLQAVPGIEVERGFSELSKRKNLKGATILVLGEQEAFLSRSGKKELAALQGLISAGNRLVVGFLPRTGAAPAVTPKQDAGAKPNKAEEKGKPRASDGEPQQCLGELWGLAPDHFPDTGLGVSLRQATSGADALSLPEQLPRHSRLCFQVSGADWQTVYRSGERPVIIERRLGQGSIVVLADCYLLSNEALRGEPNGSLLSWLIGANHRVLFDEFHLGVGDEPGMGLLVRRYHLETFFAALLLLALLYIWKSSVPFLRVLPAPASAVESSGKDNFAGLVNLLRRTIARERLLDTCFKEWRRSCGRDFRRHPEKLAQVEALLVRESALPPRQRDAEGAYRGICLLLARKGIHKEN